MKATLVKSLSVVISKGNREVPIFRTQFFIGEAFLIKDEAGSRILVLKSGREYNELYLFLQMISYDVVNADCILHSINMREYHAMTLIAFNRNPAGLMLRVNDTSMAELEYTEI